MQAAALGFVGAGNMAEAIARSVLHAGLFPPRALLAADPSPQRRQVFEELGIATSADSRAVARDSRVMLLAIKPQHCAAVLADLADLLDSDRLLISILAGVSTRSIEDAIGHASLRVVRVMPNLPMQVGAGMAALCRGRHASADDLAIATRIFEAGGRTLTLDDEDQMHAVTALSGSGPAYYFLFSEALIEAGERAGLTRAQAELLVRQTSLGAARLLEQGSESAQALRARVTSPGGTTAAAMQQLEANQVREAIVTAALAAQQRSRELGG